MRIPQSDRAAIYFLKKKKKWFKTAGLKRKKQTDDLIGSELESIKDTKNFELVISSPGLGLNVEVH